ncbi:CAAX protease [Methanosarcina mazei]|jgi:hypothetical protein|uniref:CAAX protease n=2 Tax=Methanosarcina mazei TaxID=2209 RepID=A0A0F8ICT7_METMZ|nr:CAAX protease [Methanosarcina mazei]KKG87522.1 CAAX protease [Methanosarcina mazei]
MQKKPSSITITSALILTLLVTSPSITRIKEVIQEKEELKKLRLYITIPVLGIALAELLFFSDRTAAAACVHIGILIALSLSNIFTEDPKIHNLYMSLMLLPLLRLVNLSVPIFLDTTLYTFIFTYAPLAVAAEIVIIYQQISFEEIGITTKNLPIYMVLSVPLGFLLGLGEFMTIKVGSLIPDVTFGNFLELFSIMVLFVSLVEELIFRSILQTRFEKLLDARWALVVTSFLFGLMHSGYGTFYEIFYTSFAGFVIGFAFYRTRSLPFVVLLHGFANVFLFGVLPHDIGWSWF